MKNTAKRIVPALLIGLVAITSYSQTDSAGVEYSQEKATPSNKMDEAICDILTRRENKGKSLWKFNLAGTFLGGFNIAYERKLTPVWSLNVSSVTNLYEVSAYYYRFYRSRHYWNRQLNFKENLGLELRYYHNQYRRIRVGKKAGFSGNYLGLGMNNAYTYVYTRTYDPPSVASGPPDFYDHNYYRFSCSLNFIYGIQRRIGRIGYIDASAGLGVTYVTARYRSWPGSKNYAFEISTPLKLGIGIAF